ncbi:hypothetical protein P3S68_003358 [Capsicum galapagoense]
MEKAFSSFLLTLLLLLYYVKASSAMTQTNITTDQLVLLALKSHIISDPFHFLDESWSLATSICHWVGVTCGSCHRRVKFLNLSNMALTGRIPQMVPSWFGFLHQLQVLSLRNNSFTGSIPSSFFNITKLETLDLTFNSLDGQFPKEIKGVENLRYFSLYGNNLIGSIPPSLMNASRLETLDLSRNSIQGNIPEEIGNLHNMNWLAIQYNQLMGSIPFTIFNISRIEVISFTGNSLSGYLPNGEIPKEISNLVELEELNLQNNSFRSLPPNMCSVIPNIEEIYLSSLTNLVGTIPHSISNYSKLTRLELSSNKLTVLIPNSLGYLTHLQDLNLGGNNLTSDSSLSFLISLTNCRDLTYLSLYLNPLNGMLPVSVGNFSTSLRIFYANSCKIKGRIPNEVGNSSRLLSLDLSGNNLVGSIPTSIGNLRNLQRFDFSNNKLTGFIVDHRCKLQHLGEIYLGQNQHSGSLPNCLGNITSLREIHLGSNKLSSNIPSSLGNLKDLVVLDLSSNNMVGSLPPEIEKLKAAMLIDLSMNQFSNGIPREIGGLQNLVHLSLRHNKLQGSILDSVCNMVGGPFKNLSSQFFNYNEALCGSSRFIVPPCPTSSKHRSSRKKEIVLFLLLGIALVFVPSTFVSFWIRYRRGKRAPQQADSLPTVTRERISYYELLQEMDDLSESNLIGFGSFGSVYKGVLRSGTVTAVKVFNLQLDAAFKSFDTECEVLRGLRHRNLVKVITSCSDLDFKALVLEYMPNGSLETHLYLHNYFLDIRQRLSIMIEVACALEYLHHGCSSPVIHCDLKTSNVLLDEDMVAHLSDFGIFKTAW